MPRISFKKIVIMFLISSLIPAILPSASALDTTNWDDISHSCSTSYTSVVNTSTALYTYTEMVADIDALVSAFPSIASKQWVCASGNQADSKSVAGRPIPALVIGSNTAAHRFLIIGSMHAREYINTQLIMLQAEFILHNLSNTIYTGTGDEESLSSIINDCQFYFVPMANPDGTMLSQNYDDFDSLSGYDLSAGEIEDYTDFLTELQDIMNEDYVSQTASEHDDNWTAPTAPDVDFRYVKCNLNGVDIHYNFYSNDQYEWIEDSGFFDRDTWHVDGPMYRDYIGASGESEPETAAIADYCREKKFDIVISYHSVLGKDGDSSADDDVDGGCVTWNYGLYQDYPDSSTRTTQYNQLKNIGDTLAEFMQYTSPTTYHASFGFAGWYMHNFPRSFACVVETGMLDYFKDNLGSPEKDIDACPLEIKQLKYDVTTASKTRYCIWKRQMLAPVYAAKYIMSTGYTEEYMYDTVPAAPRFLAIAQTGNAGMTANISYEIPEDTGGNSITGQKLYHSTDGTNYSYYTTNVSHSSQTFTATGLSSGMHYFKIKLTNSEGDSDLSSESVSMEVTPFTNTEITGIKYDGGSFSTYFNKYGDENYIIGTIYNKCVIEKTNYSTAGTLYFTPEDAINISASATGATFYSDPMCTSDVSSSTFSLNSSNPCLMFYAKVTSSNYPSGIYYKIILTMTGLDSNNDIVKVKKYGTSCTDELYYGENADYPAVYTSVATTDNTIVPADIVLKSDDATFQLYSSPDFSAGSEITAENPAFIPGREDEAINYFYVKSVAERGDVRYSRILVRRTLETDDEQSTELSKIVVSSGISYDYGAGTPEAPKTAIRENFSDRTNANVANDVAGQTGSTITFYTDDTYATVLQNTTYNLNSGNPEYVAYAELVADDATTTTYYIIRIRHEDY